MCFYMEEELGDTGIDITTISPSLILLIAHCAFMYVRSCLKLNLSSAARNCKIKNLCVCVCVCVCVCGARALFFF